MKEEVTEYETVERKQEQIISDLSGDVIEDDDVIELHANPQADLNHSKKTVKNLQSNLRRAANEVPSGTVASKQLRNQTELILENVRNEVDVESEGCIHVSKSEFASLAGIEGEFEGGKEIPEILVKNKEPEVVHIIDLGDKYTRRFLAFISIFFLMGVAIFLDTKAFVGVASVIVLTLVILVFFFE